MLLRILGTAAALAGIAWFILLEGWSATISSLLRADWLTLSAVIPLIVLNMGLRAQRWRSLLGSPTEVPLFTAFSAQMIGYLANNLLPVRAGDLVRILVLGNTVALSRSRILSTVLLERILDMAMVVFLLAMMGLVSSLPDWMRTAAVLVASVTTAGIAAVVAVSIWGAPVVVGLVHLVPRMPIILRARLEFWAREFSLGVQRIRSPLVAVSFFAGTLAIWATEVGLVLIVAVALNLYLVPLDAAVLMLFSLFSSFMPALPGQIGTFEIAMLVGLDFVERSGPAALPFALVLHIVLLVGTTLLGIACVMANRMPLSPRLLINRARTS
jgi:uncharacterized protein (TIRG00374 family)